MQKEKQYKGKLNYAEISRNKYILSDPNEQKEEYDKNNKTNRNKKVLITILENYQKYIYLIKMKKKF